MDKILNGQAQQKFLTSQFLLTIQYIINQRKKYVKINIPKEQNVLNIRLLIGLTEKCLE